MTRKQLENERLRKEHRLNPELSPVRYDEIIDLRMLLLDVEEQIGVLSVQLENAPQLHEIRRRINDRAKKWGKKGDVA